MKVFATEEPLALTCCAQTTEECWDGVSKWVTVFEAIMGGRRRVKLEAVGNTAAPELRRYAGAGLFTADVKMAGCMDDNS